MLKWGLRIVGIVIVLIAAAVLIFRTPDTDPAEMRAKYGGEPSRFVALDDGTIVHLREEGPRDGLPIVLLHGSNADLHTWQPWVYRLSDDYRVVRFDQIGHGLTGPHPDNDYDRARFVETVDAVADRLGLDRFVLGGNSMGGGIAAAYALEHPRRVAGLILVDASGAPVRREQGGGNIGFTIAQTPGLRNLMTQVTPRSMVRASLEQSVSNKAIVTPEAVDRYWELLRYPGNRAATLARFGQTRPSFTRAKMAKLQMPVLIIWGAEDALIPAAAGDWFADALPDARLVSYPGIGHLPMEEAPDRSARDVRAWLETRVAPTFAESQGVAGRAVPSSVR